MTIKKKNLDYNFDVAVIMSTYNGKKYVKEQIDSVLNQEKVNVTIYIRDDGSIDDTLSLLKDYNGNSEIKITAGDNLGFRKSFIKALLMAGKHDYYAFCDQDDYWEKEKLYEGCKKIIESDSNNACLYYSNLETCDEKLNNLGRTYLEKRNNSLYGIVMRRSIAGCTMIFNRKLCELLRKIDITDELLVYGHDAFVITTCFAVGGNVICDSRHFIKYRQHGNNTSGSHAGFKQRLEKELSTIFRLKKLPHEPTIAESLLMQKNIDIAPESKQILNVISRCKKHFFTRLYVFFSPKFVTGDLRLTIWGKLIYLLGWM
jgi:rhamnosyltransferase